MTQENFSNAFVRTQCGTINNSKNNINQYLDKYCRTNDHKTINEEMDCRYYDDKLIHMQVNENSWCNAPTKEQIIEKTPEELRNYLKEEMGKSNRLNNYYDTHIVNNNVVNEENHLNEYYMKRKNPYKWELPLSNDQHEPEPTERQFLYNIKRGDEYKLTMMDPYVSGFTR
jgi:hypothetical protein